MDDFTGTACEEIGGGAPATHLPPNPCAACGARTMCLGHALTTQAAFGIPLIARRRLRAGEAVYRAGEDFHSAYAVRSGTFKTAVPYGEDREQVTAFHLQGDLMGLDGLAVGEHAASAYALEDAEVCCLPYSLISDTARDARELHQALWSRLAVEMLREQELATLLATTRAEARVAAFLLYVAGRMKARGYSSREFYLRMSRADIGSYLGITVETVSRALSAFAEQGLIYVHKKHIRILDAEGLAREGPEAMTLRVFEAQA